MRVNGSRGESGEESVDLVVRRWRNRLRRLAAGPVLPLVLRVRWLGWCGEKARAIVAPWPFSRPESTPHSPRGAAATHTCSRRGNASQGQLTETLARAPSPSAGT